MITRRKIWIATFVTLFICVAYGQGLTYVISSFWQKVLQTTSKTAAQTSLGIPTNVVSLATTNFVISQINTLSNVSATVSLPTLVSGQVYTNNTGRTIWLGFNVCMTNVSVTERLFDFRFGGAGQSWYMTNSIYLGTGAATNCEFISGYVTNTGTYVLTNTLNGGNIGIRNFTQITF